MKRIHLIILICFGLACMCCNRKTNSEGASNSAKNKSIPELPRFIKTFTASDTLALNTDTLLYYQRSACFGFCPTYNYTVFQNGLIRYDGQQHIEPLGTKYDLVTDAWWNQIIVKMKLANFFDLAQVYPIDPKMYIPDLPNTIIIIKEFGKRKAVIDNHDAPKELKEFEFYLERKFKDIEFKK